MRTIHLWGPLLMGSAVMAMGLSFLTIRESAALGPADFVAGLSLTWLLTMWVVQDAHQRRRVPCHDFGFLVALFLPWSLAWYLLWTRGWRGLLTLAALGLVWLAPAILAVLAGVAWVVFGAWRAGELPIR